MADQTSGTKPRRFGTIPPFLQRTVTDTLSLVLVLAVGLVAANMWVSLNSKTAGLLKKALAAEKAEDRPAKEIELRGQIGDGFAAVNTAFTGITLVLVFFAVSMQQMEIKLLRKTAANSRADSLKAEARSAQQAEIMSTTAQLNAAGALLESMPEGKRAHAKSSAVLGGVVLSKSHAEVLQQYVRVIMNEMAHLASTDWVPRAERPSAFRLYATHLVREHLATVDATGPASAATLAGLVPALLDEFALLLLQDTLACDAGPGRDRNPDVVAFTECHARLRALCGGPTPSAPPTANGPNGLRDALLGLEAVLVPAKQAGRPSSLDVDAHRRQ